MESVDLDYQELRDKIDRISATTEDTHKMVRGMRRSQRWATFFQIVWWLLILGASGAAYYYMQPYINQVIGMYQNVQAGSQKAQGFEQKISDYLKEHFGSSSTPK